MFLFCNPLTQMKHSSIFYFVNGIMFPWNSEKKNNLKHMLGVNRNFGG